MKNKLDEVISAVENGEEDKAVNYFKHLTKDARLSILLSLVIATDATIAGKISTGTARGILALLIQSIY